MTGRWANPMGLNDFTFEDTNIKIGIEPGSVNVGFGGQADNIWLPVTAHQLKNPIPQGRLAAAALADDENDTRVRHEAKPHRVGRRSPRWCFGRVNADPGIDTSRDRFQVKRPKRRLVH